MVAGVLLPAAIERIRRMALHRTRGHCPVAHGRPCAESVDLLKAHRSMRRATTRCRKAKPIQESGRQRRSLAASLSPPSPAGGDAADHTNGRARPRFSRQRFNAPFGKQRLKLLDILRRIAMTDKHGVRGFNDDQVFDTAQRNQAFRCLGRCYFEPRARRRRRVPYFRLHRAQGDQEEPSTSRHRPNRTAALNASTSEAFSMIA